MFVAMGNRAPLRSFRTTAVAFVLLAGTSCSGEKSDPDQRNIPWTYGPTTSEAGADHLRATGTKGGAAITRGWQCSVDKANRLTIRPFQLAASHPLFGKVLMNVRLYDKAEAELQTVQTGPITAENATFTFDLPEAIANRLCDVVIWYRGV